MKTFYIAASSDEAQRVAVQELAKTLFQQFGWQWHNNYDWTNGFEAENNYPPHELVWRAQMDLVSARDADIFIYMETATRSLGANREYGVRWGQGLRIYRVTEQPDHLFDMLQHVVTLKTIKELVEVLETREVA